MNNYTLIPNELWDSMIDNKEFSRQTRIWAMIARYTICFHREFHELSLSFIADRIEIRRDKVSEEIKKMCDSKMLRSLQEGNKRLLAIGFSVPENGNVSVPVFGNTGVPEKGNQEINNTKINNLNIEQFETFWSVYPRKVAKADAEKAFQAAVKKVPFQQILTGAREYCAFVDREHKDLKYIKYPAGWLRSELWNDYQPVAAGASKIVKLITQNELSDEHRERIRRIHEIRDARKKD